MKINLRSHLNNYQQAVLEKYKDYIREEWIKLLENPLLSLNLTPIGKEYSQHKCYPEHDDIFAAFSKFDPKDLRVVIVGQDVYHDGSSIGVAFDNRTSKKPSPSLRNIIKECEADTGFSKGENSYLEKWTEQGVLLINTALTVREGSPGSHIDYWQDFSKGVIESINTLDNIVWILWGKYAQSYSTYITNPTHKVITGAHPSPLSSSKFFGGKYFSKANKFLTTPIKW